ncbi:hypothetical protein HJC23_003189 [Cyclotella cryptica]|uniref:DUF393 domain-containing protein n=1 Tax=Cyclotella cryptica TaxID=29204 RepID=A0ABD3NW00_9STRA|eukprot:CCRYP_020174-RA/>CCRYP_020174-RA protein AED:0.00 eAED:0.00 QI:17/-1/1/1/-1/1/1/158/447
MSLPISALTCLIPSTPLISFTAPGGRTLYLMRPRPGCLEDMMIMAVPRRCPPSPADTIKYFCNCAVRYSLLNEASPVRLLKTMPPHALDMVASIVIFLSALMILTSSGAGAFSPSSLVTSSSSTSTTSLSATAPTSFALFGLAAKRSHRQTKQQRQQQHDNSMFAIPSIFHPSDTRPVVLFDGKCNLCNAGVQLVLDYDRASSDARGNLRVAALQSRVGKLLLARLPQWQRDLVVPGGEAGESYKSIVVTSPHRTWINSAACIRIGRELRGPLRYLAWLAWIIPPFIRDPMYKLLSRHRKKLFGESPECRLWDDNWDTRFVDDAMFGGRGANVDPFADPSAVAAQEEEEDDEDDERNVEQAMPPSVGDSVRVVSSKPILHTHVPGYEEHGLCSVGLVGTVTRVLNQRSYPKNVAVMFQLEEESDSGDGNAATQFEAHFYPWQLRKEE